MRAESNLTSKSKEKHDHEGEKDNDGEVACSVLLHFAFLVHIGVFGYVTCSICRWILGSYRQRIFAPVEHYFYRYTGKLDGNIGPGYACRPNHRLLERILQKNHVRKDNH